MKHLILLVIVLLNFTSLLFAQEERKVLVEVFTNSHCPSCPNAHNVLEAYLAGSNGAKISFIFYHMIYPYSDDPLYAQSMEDSDARNDYYSPVPFTPQGWFDSFHQGSTTTWKSSLDTLVTKDSPLKIQLNGTKSATQFNINAKLTRTGYISDSDLVIHFVVAEDVYFDGRNSISYHKHVMRKMLPTADGESFTIDLNEEKDFKQTIDLDSLWDVDSLSVIVFVQSNASKTVYQSETINYSSLTITSIDDEGETPTEFTLGQNYPNPFNPVTKIKYTIPSVTLRWQSHRHAQGDILVSLKVFDVLGNEVATLVNEIKPSGVYEVEFDASYFPSGVYFYQLRAGDFIESKKMTLIK
jgi:hypothetical protein